MESLKNIQASISNNFETARPDDDKAGSACSFYRNRNIPPKSHICAMNFSGPSTGMEQDIILEGFSKSIEHHGGDGDSSVYARVLEKVSYGRCNGSIQTSLFKLF
ncbi:uncharacterized protein LOC123306972 [Coccinella septempunctata]|uniref:uncharacterized protein LOC123306972 n=1 Tax=Coccinella septempunctata TaxID=41139 RepID=UPI001D078679|nr:uncharacterized protein LOC123306972 [Coccinella septempunctata]